MAGDWRFLCSSPGLTKIPPLINRVWYEGKLCSGEEGRRKSKDTYHSDVLLLRTQLQKYQPKLILPLFPTIISANMTCLTPSWEFSRPNNRKCRLPCVWAWACNRTVFVSPANKDQGVIRYQISSQYRRKHVKTTSDQLHIYYGFYWE